MFFKVVYFLSSTKQLGFSTQNKHKIYTYMLVLDTNKIPDHVTALFRPPPVLKYLAPTDYASGCRKTTSISGSSSYLDLLKAHDPDYVAQETVTEARERLRQERQEKHKQHLQKLSSQWNPSQDPQIQGDAAKTLFVGRLNYNLTDADLHREFSKYGPIEHVRIVRDKDGKPRGYAFIVYEHERDMRTAFRETRGLKINSRRVVVDIERGRTVPGWLPRKLGGGRGGRHYTKEEMFKAREAMRRVGGGPVAGDRRHEKPYDRPSSREDKRFDRPPREDRRPYDDRRSYDRRQQDDRRYEDKYRFQSPRDSDRKNRYREDDRRYRTDDREREKERMRMQFDEKRREANQHGSRLDPRDRNSVDRWRY